MTWRLWIDTGGTFTDCLAVAPDGALHRAKVLSSAALRGTVGESLGPRELRLEAPWHLPDGFFDGARFRLLDGSQVVRVVAFRGEPPVVELERELAGSPGAACEIACDEEAPTLAARMVTGTSFGRPLPPIAMRLATTRGTNALLERTGARTAFFVTAGFSDLLAIGSQQRPDLFALHVRKSDPLPAAVVEVPERLAADGSIVAALDLGPVERALPALRAAGIESAAVALLHSYRNPAHERRVADLLRGAGFAHVACSSDLAPRIRLLERAQTAVVEAYLAPVVQRYLERVEGALAAGSSLHVMTSAGGLARGSDFRAKDSLLSGPAGGVVGALLAGAQSGFRKVIAFDMGGTSTDVARCDGDLEYEFETEVAGVRLLAPSLAIATVAAGGGSICAANGARLTVGPQSAGARPGPACYGAGGPLTLTDANLLLGRLAPEWFEIPIRAAAAEAAADATVGTGTDREALLEGFLRIADERMADAVRRISVRRGYDPREYALVAFGGAGGQHACALAALLGIAAVVVPADAGLLSAVGLGHARVQRIAQRQVLAPLAAIEPSLAALLAELAAEAVAAVAAEGVPQQEVVVRRRILQLRLAGQESTLAVESWDEGDVGAAFAAAYRELYGYAPPARPVEVESAQVVAASQREQEAALPDPAPLPAPPVADVRRSWIDGAWREVPAFARRELAPGTAVPGPALVLERHATTVVAAGWQARVDGATALVLEADP